MATPLQSTSYVNNASVADTSDYTQMWSQAFNPQAVNHVLNNPDRKQRTTTHDLPDSGFGQSQEFLGTTMDLQILTSETWYTKVALPIKQRLNTKGITWNKFIFDRQHVDPIPMRGVSRLVDSRRETRQEGFLRYGLGFRMEHGYMETEEGRMVYQMTLAQIANAVDEANKFDVLHAIVTAPRYEVEWNAKFGAISSKDVRARLADEKMTWGILQKEKNGFEKLDTILVRKMRRYRVDANMYIFPEEAAMYLRVVPNEKTDAFLAGEAGPARLRNYDSTEPYVMYGKYRVYMARTYAVDVDEDIDLLVRERQIGEYHLLIDRYKDRDVENHRSEDQSVMIYDEDNDEFSLLTMKHAIQYGQLFEKVYDARVPGGQREQLRMPVPNHAVPHWQQDLKHDFLLRPNAQSEYGYEPIELFGEMAQSAFSTQSTLNLATTLINRVAKSYLNGAAEAQAIMAEGLEVLDGIAGRAPTTAWLVSVAQANANARDLETSKADGRYVKENAKFVWAMNSDGGFELPDISKAGPDVKRSALVGFANWPGMVAMAKEAGTASGTPSTAKGYAAADLKAVAKLVTLVRRLVQAVGPVLRQSLALDAGYTPLQYGKKSAEAVLVDNLLGLGGHAAWLRRGLTADAGTGVSATAIAAFQRDQKPARDNINAAATAGGLTDAQKNTLVDLVPNNLDDTTTNETVQRGQAFADAIVKLNVYDGGDAATQRMRKFAATFSVPDNQNVDALAKYILDNVGDFQGTTKALKAFIVDLKSSMAAAKADQTALATKYAGDPLVAADVYRSAAATAAANDQLYRSPLTMSATQVLQLAKLVSGQNLAASVSAPGSNQTRAATAAELARLARTIQAINDDPVSTEARMATNDMLFEPDMADLQRLHVVRLAQQQNQLNAASARRPAATGRRPRNRRRFAAEVMRETDAEEGEAMEVDDYAAGAGVAGDDGRYEGPSYGSFKGALAVNYTDVEEKATDALTVVLAKAYQLTPITSTALNAMVDNHVLVPLSTIVARLHMRYNMKMCVKMVPGDQTGNMWMGYTYFALGDDIKTQVQTGEYRYWGKAVVTEEKNIHVMYDVFCAGRLGGAGVQPVDVETYDPHNAKYGDGDLLFFITPYEMTSYADPIDASGRFEYFDQANLDDREAFRQLHYPTAARYNGVLGFRNVNDMGYNVEDYQHPWKTVYKEGEVVPNNVPFNTVMWRGEEHYFNRATQNFDAVKRGTGHWGGFTYVGVRDARDGHFVSMNRNDTNHVTISAR